MPECEVNAYGEDPENYLERRLYGLSDLLAAEETGVLRLRRQPFLNLTGRGILLGIADTGIDYTHLAFRYGDGKSRILAIWDQTAEDEETKAVPFGRVYTKAELDEALERANPYETVPAGDENGHGTFMAGLAAGNEEDEEGFTGIAPNAELVVVKLREAKECLKSFWFVPQNVPAYEEADLIAATDFMIGFAVEQQKPLVLYYGIASSQGDHNGSGDFSEYLNLISLQSGRAVVISGGNEGNAAHHFKSRSYEGVAYQDAEIRVSGISTGLYVEFWADAPDLYAIGFVSPEGEVVEKLPARTSYREVIPFVFSPTVIHVIYERSEPVTGAARIRIFMKEPSDGIWKIRIFAQEIYGGRFDLWMPIRPFIDGEAVFLRPDPDTTITEPGNSSQSLTVTAYDTSTGGIYLDSSRGFTREERVKPDLTAPGVSILGPSRGGLYTRRTGSSVAAAVTAGIALLLMEYDPSYTGVQIKNYLIRGANRDGEDYPNPLSGWGKADAYETFRKMSET